MNKCQIYECSENGCENCSFCRRSIGCESCGAEISPKDDKVIVTETNEVMCPSCLHPISMKKFCGVNNS